MSEIWCPQKGIRFIANPEKSLMDNLLNQGLPVASSCRGDGICGKCRMWIESQEPLPSPSPLEMKTLQKNQAGPGERLSCQYYCQYDVKVRTTYW